ncbi:MAG: hypothetical protein ACRCTZ_00680 [Sarcina sp.]
MENKTKVLTLVTVVSSIITTVLILSYFTGSGLSLEFGILFLAITEMLIGVAQYELARSKENKSYNLIGDLCIFVGIIILIVVIGSRII